jgi:hypothetical protein
MKTILQAALLPLAIAAVLTGLITLNTQIVYASNMPCTQCGGHAPGTACEAHIGMGPCGWDSCINGVGNCIIVANCGQYSSCGIIQN